VREPDAATLAGLAALLQSRVGLALRPEAQAALRLAVLARYEDPRPPAAPLEGYVDLLSSAAGEEELRRLLPLVTVGKTDFFRDERQFGALALLFPGLLAAARARGRPVSIWSAGCATGEEPYTIAMLAAEAGAGPGELELLATDVNPEALACAREGRYAARKVKAIPPALVARWLEPDGEGWRVGERLRGLLSRAEVHNLVAGPAPRPRSGAWDAVFCRNVIIYFDTPTAQGVLGRFLEGLAPGGWLFLGYSESLFRLFEGFDLCEVGGAFLYRRPEAGGPPVPDRRLHAPSPHYAPATVHHAHPPSEGPAPRMAFSTQELLEATVQLCAAGRFAEARGRLLQHLAAGPGGSPDDLPARLTLANLHGILREGEAATGCYRAALQQEPLSAEAHLLYGIHLLGQGDAGGAAEELTRSLFLDPDGAIAHYFLGRCREAQRDAERARRSYHNAIEAHARRPAGRSQPFVGYYPDLPEDGAAFARAAEYALKAL
jgi:chemotaxis protein methyltransferase CheR